MDGIPSVLSFLMWFIVFGLIIYDLVRKPNKVKEDYQNIALMGFFTFVVLIVLIILLS